jgi:hypothetical protein
MIRKKARIKSKGKQMKSKNASSARKKAVHKKKNAKTKLGKRALKKKTAAKGAVPTRRTVAKKGAVNREEELAKDLRSRNFVSSGRKSVRQNSDLQGVSRVQAADSESVDELVEEGNLFEAGAVAGVEEADSADEREVHTHEVAEDDVPEEYLDQD